MTRIHIEKLDNGFMVSVEPEIVLQPSLGLVEGAPEKPQRLVFTSPEQVLGWLKKEIYSAGEI